MDPARPSVAILGTEASLCAKLVADRLERRGARVVWLPRLRNIAFQWQGADLSAKVILTDGNLFDLSELRSAFLRSPGPSEDFAGMDPSEERYFRSEGGAIWSALIGTLGCRLVNPPRSDQRTRIDRFTAEERRDGCRAGVGFPPTILTSHVSDAIAFFAAASRRVSILTTSGLGPMRVIEGTGAEPEISEIVSRGPVRMTALPAGERLAAFVCGEHATLAHLASNGTWDLDERRSTRLAEGCVRVARSLRLEFAELSLVEDEAGALHCLTVDSLPELDSATEALRERVVAHLAERLVTLGGPRET